jgi:hypothetical protein
VKGRYHPEDLHAGGKIILKLINGIDLSAWVGFTWLRIGICGGLL